jgi:multidrug efflux pump subunit AcrB
MGFAKKEDKTKTRNKWLPRISLFAFDRPRFFIFLWLVLVIFGLVSYTTLHKREGFPSVNIPFSVINGVYLVNDPSKVDAEVTGPISDIVLEDERVQTALATARGTFYTVVVQYGEDTNANAAGKELEQKIKDAGVLPSQATAVFTTPRFGFTERGDDAVISVYSDGQTKTAAELSAEGEKLAERLQVANLPSVENASVIDEFARGVDPATGQQAVVQTAFDRYGVRQSGDNRFFDSIAVGVDQGKGGDVIEFDDGLRAEVNDYNREQTEAGSPYRAAVSASYAPQIKEQIDELQRALLEGLLAVLIVGSLIIAIRASLIIVLAMITVLSITLGLMLGIGYTLNTITLFSLILCLALIVDDTIIMTEAIDAQRRRRKDAREVVKVATGKISLAMMSATFTAAFSFAALIFVGGLLGNFIRAIPVTVIMSLLVSLLVAIVFIPVFARFLLLRRGQMGEKNVHEPAAGVEAAIARFISRPMMWARGSTKKLLAVGSGAILLGLAFILAAGFLFQKVTFNIFPPTKDSNGLIVQLEFPVGSEVEDAMQAARDSDEIAGKNLGGNFRQASYYATGDSLNASLFIEITPYDERDIRSPQLVAQMEQAYKDAGYSEAKVSVSQQDIGPPAAAFTVRVQTDGQREAALKLAGDIQKFLDGRELVRLSGEPAHVTKVSVSDPGTYERADGDPFVQVGANFDGTDTTTLVGLAQDAVEEEFTPEKVASYGLPEDALNFDFGQESENQESFQALALAFPAVMLAIYILLAFQFRSLMQPLLIFTAVPFSLFGITFGLYITDNAFSFFAMLGFFALIGLSLKNTILLTDYANQQRRLGVGVVDSTVEALSERFRPLIATSLTAVVSLAPLALMSPFWEGLAVVLIFGLLSSTFLVILVFPYYYLGVEFLRRGTSRLFRRIFRRKH